MSKLDPQIKEITDTTLKKSGAKVKISEDGTVSGPPEEYWKFLSACVPKGQTIKPIDDLVALLAKQAAKDFAKIEIHGLYHRPDFITKDEEAALIEQIDRQPWLTDLKRRVQHYSINTITRPAP